MKKKIRQILSALLVAVMLIGIAPAGIVGKEMAQAAEYDCLEDMPMVSESHYTGNEGDSRVFNLNRKGLPGNDNKYYRNGNVGLDGTTYNNGFEIWVARWNFGDKISWASATFDIGGKYKTLSGKSGIVMGSANTKSYDASVYFYNGDSLLYSFRITPDDYEKSFEIDVSGVSTLTLMVKDNKETAGGTSYALYDLFFDKNFQQNSVGDIIEFGSYPQSKVTDSATLDKLNKEIKNWISYGYYSGMGETSDGNMKPSDYMKYADFSYGGNKYRAVTFSEYRPYETGYKSSSSNSYQDDNGYYTDNVYYFKYEPLRWRVLNASTGLVICDSAIDSQAYNNYIINSNGEYYGDSGENYYASDWENSSLRKWLNEDFYNTAFSKLQQDRIKELTRDNKSNYDSNYDSNPTSDKITLLSYLDVTSYGLNYTARQRKSTDYAQCQGCWTSTSSSDNGNSWWWLRSPYSSGKATGVNYDGWAPFIYHYYYDVYDTHRGIVPALNLDNPTNLKSSVQSMSDDEAKDFICFIYNISANKLTDDMLSSGNLYNLLTGRLTPGSAEEFAAKVAMLELVRLNVNKNANQSKSRCAVTMDNVIKYLEGYVEGKDIDDGMTRSFLNKIIDGCIEEIVNQVGGYFNVSVENIDKIRLAKSSVSEIISIPQKIREIEEKVTLAANSYIYVCESNISLCYDYFNSYLSNYDLAVNEPETREVIDWCNNFNFSQYQLKTLGTNILFSALGIGHTKDAKTLIEKYAEYVYNVENSLNTQSGYADGSGQNSYESKDAEGVYNSRDIYDERAAKQETERDIQSSENDSFTVTFCSNYANGENISLDVVPGGTYSCPKVSRSGYKFDGWYNDSSCTSAWDYRASGNKTLYAKWLKICKVTFKSNFTGIADTTFNVLEGYKIDFKSNGMIAPSNMNMERAEYAFCGWYKNNDLLSRYKNTVTINDDTVFYAKWKCLYNYRIENNNAIITGVNGYFSANVVIPSKLDGYVVSEISDKAFANQSWLNSITLPSTVTKLGEMCFYGCTSLTDITIKASKINAESYAFSGCKSLKSFDFRKIDEISEGMFSFSGIQVDSLPSNISKIDNLSFAGCMAIKNITLSDNIKAVGSGAFMGCKNLKNFILPKSIQKIENSLFNNCISLESINVDSTIKQIGNNSFEGCLSLKELNLTDSITAIGDEAFLGCIKLGEIHISKNTTSIGSNAIDKSSVIYCYDGSYAYSYAKKNSLKYILVDKMLSSKKDSVIIDDENMLIYGIKNPSEIRDSFYVEGDCSLMLTESKNKIGIENEIVILNSSGKELRKYSIIILGDVNGDGCRDGQDAVLVKCLAFKLLTPEYVGKSAWKSSDYNQDGLVDDKDVVSLEQLGLLNQGL